MTNSLDNNDFLKGFGRFSWFQTLLKRESVYKHEKRPNPLNILIFAMDLVFFCFETLLNPESVYKREKWPNLWRKSSRGFVISPVYRHFLDSKVSRNRKTTKSLEKWWFSKNFPVSRHILLQKMSRKWETTKFLE